MLYEVYVSSYMSISRERWLIKAPTLLVAVTKAQNKLRRSPSRFKGYEVVSAAKIGFLDIE